MSDSNRPAFAQGPAEANIITMQQIAKLSGLDCMKAICAGQLPGPAIGRTLNFKMHEVEEGMVSFIGVPSEDHYNPMGTVHGGFIATLLDSALACAVQTLCPVGYASTSVDLKINFVRPVFAATGPLTARGQVVHPGRQLATSEARLTDAAGKLYAHGTQTCSIFKIPI